MISIASAMQQDAIKELLEGYNEEGMTFTFKEKQGIKMFFETSAEDPEAAAKKAKELIKAQPWGQQLFKKMVQKDRMVDMIKNGLFLCSIGSLIVLYSLNPHSQRYDLYSMVTGLFLTGLGIYFFMKGKKREEAKEKNN